MFVVGTLLLLQWEGFPEWYSWAVQAFAGAEMYFETSAEENLRSPLEHNDDTLFHL